MFGCFIMGFNKVHRKEVIIMLDLTLSEMAELLFACNLAIQRETELAQKYEDTMPWKAQRHAQSLHELESAREKIYQAMKGV